VELEEQKAKNQGPAKRIEQALWWLSQMHLFHESCSLD
jgi:hypothetical protein